MHIPLTFRLVFHSIRATVRAGLLFVCAWLLLIPASAAEISALGAQPGTTFPDGLRPMRAAKVIVAVAPPQTYTLIANIIGPAAHPLGVQFMLTQMAAGRFLPKPAQTRPAQPTIVQTDTAISSDRDIAGPRFIKVD